MASTVPTRLFVWFTLNLKLAKQDPFDEIEMQKLEAAQEAYIAAVAAAKENQDEESIDGARSARLRLLSLVLKN